MALTDFTFFEDVESYRGSLGKDGNTTRKFRIAFSDLAAFCLELLPRWISTGTTSLTYKPGNQHPIFTAMYCETVGWECFGVPSQDPVTKISSWTEALVTATYKPNAYDAGGGGTPATVIEEDLNFSCEAISLPKRSFKKVGGTTPLDDIEGGQLLIPVCAYTLTLVDVPTLPQGSAELIFDLMGKVNSVAFRGADAGRVLFLGADTSRSTLADGTKGWKVALKFLIRPEGKEWNKLYLPSAGEFTEVEDSVSGDKLYQTTELLALLPA